MRACRHYNRMAYLYGLSAKAGRETPKMDS